jgi:hypothetical protein
MSTSAKLVLLVTTTETISITPPLWRAILTQTHRLPKADTRRLPRPAAPTRWRIVRLSLERRECTLLEREAHDVYPVR